MSLGVEIINSTGLPAGGPTIQTDTAFLAGEAAGGPTDQALPIRSLAEFAANYGARATANQDAYDWVDDFFHEGGRLAYFGRYTTSLASALALFDESLGPGQIAAVGADATAGATTYDALLDLAADTGRFALLDVGNDDTVTAMETLGGTLAARANVEHGMSAGQWLTIPAAAGVVGGTDRQVPGSATTAALIARADALGNPNRAAAGRDFPLQYASGFVRDVTLADAETLLDAGINSFLNRYGVLQLYGFQTGVPQDPDNPFWQANCGRARMAITARAKSIGENYMFKPIDGRGLLAAALKTDLEAMLSELYQANGLYGATPRDAYSVQVTGQVNTDQTVAQGELHAVAQARLSLHAKSVQINLVSVPVTGRVA
jgi:hypothetical protein